MLAEKEDGDFVYLEGLSLITVVGTDAWGRADRPQPIVLDIRVPTYLNAAAAEDDVALTVNYGVLCKKVTSMVQDATFESIFDLQRQLFAFLLQTLLPDGMQITATLPEAILLAQGGYGFSVTAAQSSTGDEPKVVKVEAPCIFFKEAQLSCIIGVNSHERLHKQRVVLNLVLHYKPEVFNALKHSHCTFFELIATHVEASSFETLEALGDDVAKLACRKEANVDKVTVSVAKPSALTFVKGAGVQITRPANYYDGQV